MQPAQDRLARGPACPDVSRAPDSGDVQRGRALVTTADASRDALVRQVTGAVQWERSMRNLVASRRRALCRDRTGKGADLADAADRSRAAAMNVEDEASLQKLKDHLATTAEKS